MKRRKKLVPLFILTLLAWLLVTWFTYKFSPEDKIRIMNPPAGEAGYELGNMILFFPLVFIALFSFFSLLLNNARRGLLVALGIVVILLLRLFKLTHPLYIVFVLVTLAVLESVFRKS